MPLKINVEHVCNNEHSFCVNCTSEFMRVRPYLKGVLVCKHFIKDLRDEGEVNSIIENVLDCSSLDFTELHKFEENINGNLVFRAKKQGTHIVYCVDKTMRICFLRAIRNFDEYKKFLEDRKRITRMVENAL